MRKGGKENILELAEKVKRGKYKLTLHDFHRAFNSRRRNKDKVDRSLYCKAMSSLLDKILDKVMYEGYVYMMPSCGRIQVTADSEKEDDLDYLYNKYRFKWNKPGYKNFVRYTLSFPRKNKESLLQHIKKEILKGNLPDRKYKQPF